MAIFKTEGNPFVVNEIGQVMHVRELTEEAKQSELYYAKWQHITHFTGAIKISSQYGWNSPREVNVRYIANPTVTDFMQGDQYTLGWATFEGTEISEEIFKAMGDEARRALEFSYEALHQWKLKEFGTIY